MAKRKNIDDERRRQIKKLLDASTPDEKRQIQCGRRGGRQLQREFVEREREPGGILARAPHYNQAITPRSRPPP